MDISNKKILVLGYALTGKSVATFLNEKGAQVTINDQSDLLNDASAQQLQAQGVELVGGGHPLELLDEDFDFIVKNPGIPYSIPFLKEATLRGIPIYTDIEVAYWFSKAPFIGVTGSNGKTTTTSLIYEMLRNRSHYQTFLGGNIGVPILDVIDGASKIDDIVLELSSFQLVGTDSYRPGIAVITNIYSAHLDYHGSHGEYVAAKTQNIDKLSKTDFLIFNYYQEELRKLVKNSVATPIPFTKDSPDDFVKEHGAYVDQQTIYFRGEAVAQLDHYKLPGIHNVENALAAVCVAKLKEISNNDIQAVLDHFEGIPHRIQHVDTIEGRQFYDDSKSTNESATITALRSFQQPIIYIGGGLDRGVTFDALLPFTENVRAAYLYGESRDKMAAAFNKADLDTVQEFETLEEATEAAYKEAKEGEVVLFSPGNASWDQFKNYELRGERFIEIVGSLKAQNIYQSQKEE